MGGGGFGQFADLRGGFMKKGNSVSEGVETPMHTMGKVGVWGILKNQGDLNNGRDHFEMEGWYPFMDYELLTKLPLSRLNKWKEIPRSGLIKES